MPKEDVLAEIQHTILVVDAALSTLPHHIGRPHAITTASPRGVSPVLPPPIELPPVAPHGAGQLSEAHPHHRLTFFL